MRILLDTHIARWAVTGSRRLWRKAQQMILDADEVHVSAATLWEIAIKHLLGRGNMPVSSAQALQAFKDAGYTLLVVKPEHAVRAEGLPGVHNDSFDRQPAGPRIPWGHTDGCGPCRATIYLSIKDSLYGDGFGIPEVPDCHTPRHSAGAGH